jgi:hypothetical protein
MYQLPYHDSAGGYSEMGYYPDEIPGISVTSYNDFGMDDSIGLDISRKKKGTAADARILSRDGTKGYVKEEFGMSGKDFKSMTSGALAHFKEVTGINFLGKDIKVEGEKRTQLDPEMLPKEVPAAVFEPYHVPAKTTIARTENIEGFVRKGDVVKEHGFSVSFPQKTKVGTKLFPQGSQLHYGHMLIEPASESSERDATLIHYKSEIPMLEKIVKDEKGLNKERKIKGEYKTEFYHSKLTPAFDEYGQPTGTAIVHEIDGVEGTAHRKLETIRDPKDPSKMKVTDDLNFFHGKVDVVKPETGKE